MEGLQVWRREELASGGRRPDYNGTRDGRMAYELWLVGRLPETMAAGYVHIGKGQRTGPHVHTVADHYTCVVSGHALLWVEGEMVALGTGDCYMVARGLLHELAAAKGEECWIFESTAPLASEEQMASDMVNARADEIAAREEEIAAAFAAANATRA